YRVHPISLTVRQRQSSTVEVPRSGPVRILIADDHDVVRAGLRQLLLERKGWEVCGEATTGRQDTAIAFQTEPDVVVMDIAMPELNGLEAARQIRKALPKTEIVILTLHLS